MGLFDTSEFMPHGYCLLWEPFLVWLHIISDITITLAYLSISATIFVIMVKRKFQVPYPWLIVLFGVFIALCGFTHLGSIITLWQPLYVLEGFLKALTALVSLGTAFLMFPLIPRAIPKLNKKQDQQHEVDS